MKNLKKIKLTNLSDSQLETNQINKITGGTACSEHCTGCIGARNAVDRGIASARAHRATV